jgi:hypothetical protein
MRFPKLLPFSVSALMISVMVGAILMAPATTQAQVAVGVSVHIGPPAIPVYAQPVVPGPGYIWTPGYWAYGPGGYYWVPGTWVMPPTVGVLWTPGYWGWASGVYVWHGGYWGPHVGFYGGINYGYGYTGVGFAGGYWRGGNYYYNRSVANVNTTVIHNTYNTTVVNNNVSRVSYNGGTGGTVARPSTNELAAERERHIAATNVQTQHERAASSNRAMLASANHGQPSVAATARPGVFKGEGVVAARPVNAEANRGGAPAANNRAAVNNGANTGANPGANGSQKGSASGAAQTQNRNQNQAQTQGAGQPHATPQQHQGQTQPAPQYQQKQGQQHQGQAQGQGQQGQGQPHQEQKQGGKPPESGGRPGGKP